MRGLQQPVWLNQYGPEQQYRNDPVRVDHTGRFGELFRMQAEPVYAEDGTTVLYYTGKIEVRGKEPVRFNRDYKTISEFSSWGVPGDLTLKPEIAAPGGNIYCSTACTTAPAVCRAATRTMNS